MIPIAMPLLDKDEADAAREVVLSGWVSQECRLPPSNVSFLLWSARLMHLRCAIARLPCTSL